MRNKALIVFVLVCLGALGVFAGEKSAKPNAAEHAAKLQAELNLTAEQTAQVEKLFAEFLPTFDAVHARQKATGEEMMALHGDTEANVGALEVKRAEMQAIHTERKTLLDARRNQMQQILNEEQFAKFKEIEASHMKKGMGGMGHGEKSGAGHGEKQGGHPH